MRRYGDVHCRVVNTKPLCRKCAVISHHEKRGLSNASVFDRHMDRLLTFGVAESTDTLGSVVHEIKLVKRCKCNATLDYVEIKSCEATVDHALFTHDHRHVSHNFENEDSCCW